MAASTMMDASYDRKRYVKHCACQARHVRDAQLWRRNAVAISTSASAHEAFSRARMHGLETDVAFLALRVVRAFLDRDRDGLRILRIGMILLRAATLPYLLAELIMTACLPVLFLADRPAVARLAATALLG